MALYGQEEKAPMYLEQKGEGEALQAEPIYSGLVIAYGVRIPPPYFLTFGNDTVWINDVPWGPRKRPPDWQTRIIKATKYPPREYDLTMNIVSTYCKCLKLYGLVAARDSVLQQYGSDTLLLSLQVSATGSGAILTWKDNRHQGIDLPGLCEASWKSPAERDSLRRAIYLPRIAELRGELQRNATIIYSYSGGRHTSLFGENATEFQNIMHDARRGVVTLDEAEIRLRKMVPKLYIPEIIAHWESWD